MDFNAIRFKTKCIRVMLPTYDQVGKVAMLTARMKPFTACLVLNYVPEALVDTFYLKQINSQQHYSNKSPQSSTPINSENSGKDESLTRNTK